MREIEETLQASELLIPLPAYRKIMAYATLCPIEISGFTEVTYNKERNAFIVGDVYLLEQNAGGSDVHMEEEDVQKFNLERIKAGAKELPRLWWHSHVNMGAFLSVTDEDTLKDRRTDGFTIALVVNKKREMVAKAYVCVEAAYRVFDEVTQVKEWIELDPLPVHIELDYERIPEALKQEVADKVKKKVTPLKHWKKGKKYLYQKTEAPLHFPKDKIGALEKIAQYDLTEQWDQDLKQWVYKSPLGGFVYVDYWNVLTEKEDQESLDAMEKEIERLAEKEGQ